jgi:hypothetical protein
MDVFFELRPERQVYHMYVRVAPGVFLDRDADGVTKVVDVREGAPAPVFDFFDFQTYEALERYILGNTGLAEEIRSRLYDAQDINEKLFEIVKSDNDTLRKIAERK